jgi:large subunit ribosomal protein L29
MKVQDIRAMSDDELSEELLKLSREQFNLRLQSATGQSARPDQFGKVRKDIARVKTIMRERDLGNATGQQDDG